MEETIYNLYAIVEGGYIEQIGVTTHSHGGSDHEKEAFLEEKAREDLRDIDIYPVPNNFMVPDMDRDGMTPGVSYRQYRMMIERNEEIALFETAFRALKAPDRPLVNISTVFLDSVDRVNTSFILNNRDLTETSEMKAFPC